MTDDGRARVSRLLQKTIKASGTRAKKEFDETLTSSDGVVRVPNAETLAAFANVEAGNVKRTYSMEDRKIEGRPSWKSQ